MRVKVRDLRRALREEFRRLDEELWQVKVGGYPIGRFSKSRAEQMAAGFRKKGGDVEVLQIETDEDELHEGHMCTVCGTDHSGREPYWHDDDDAELQCGHYVDEHPEGYHYNDTYLRNENP